MRELATRFYAVLSLGALLLAMCACSTPLESRSIPPDLAAKQQPEPPKLNDKAMDTLRLKNGELLKGEIKSLQRYTIRFDSDEFGILEIDWDKVAELRSSRPNTAVRRDFKAAYGTLLVTKDEVVVGGEDGPRRFPRSELFSLAPGDRTNLDYWSGHLAFGLSAQSGNTDQVTLNTNASLQWRAPFDRVQLNYLGNYGKVDGTETTNNHRARIFWQKDLTKEWFLWPVFLEGFRDRFQNIQIQITPAAGVGYNVANSSTLQVAVLVGAGWRHTQFDTSSPTESRSTSAANWVPALMVDWEVTSDIDFDLHLTSLNSLENSNDTVTHLDSTLSIDLIGDLDLNVTFQWDRVGEPQESSSGDVPDKNDFRYAVGLGLDF